MLANAQPFGTVNDATIAPVGVWSATRVPGCSELAMACVFWPRYTSVPVLAPEAAWRVKLWPAGMVAADGSCTGMVPTISVQPLKFRGWLPMS